MDERVSGVGRVLELIQREPQPHDAAAGVVGDLTKLCLVLVREFPATGAGVSLIAEHDAGGTAAASGDTGRALEELQFTLGEGPCLDAHTSRRALLVDDLDGEARRRWPVYTPAARGYGVRAVFAFPLQLGAARLGALDIYRDSPGALSSAALRAGYLFADVAVRILLTGQDGIRRGDAADGLDDGLDDALAYRMEVYQAQGMIMVDLGVGLVEALARLRGYAFASGRTITEVAHDILAGELTLDRDHP